MPSALSRRRPLPLTACAALAVALGPARLPAQQVPPPVVPYGYAVSELPSGDPIPLGPGMWIQRVRACRPTAVPMAPPLCTDLGWRPTGFVFGAHREFAVALAFGGNGRGRVLVSTTDAVWGTDSRGADWWQVAWPSTRRPTRIALSPTSLTGAALAVDTVFFTRDGGRTWSGSVVLPERRLVDALPSGRMVVVTDAEGGVWRVREDGTADVLSPSGERSRFRARPWLTLSDAGTPAEAVQVSDGERMLRVTDTTESMLGPERRWSE